METFFIGFFGHAGIHIGPLGVFTLSGGQQIGRSITQFAQRFEPQLGMFLLVLSRLQKEGRDLFITGLFRYRSKIGVLVSGLGFARKGFSQVLLCFCTSIFTHNNDILFSYNLLKIRCRMYYPEGLTTSSGNSL